MFDIDPSTGQLITKAPLDKETKGSYTVMVTVTDSETPANSDEQSVMINVTNVVEAPLAPHPPTVVSTGEDDTSTDDMDESTTSLKVVWHPPDNMGRPTITAYAVQFKESTGTSFGTHRSRRYYRHHRRDHRAGGRYFLRRAGPGDEH